MLLKIHRSYRNVVALVDSSLLGKKFEEGKRQLEIKEHFFKGDEISYEQVIDVLQRQLVEDATFTIVGKESIAAAVEVGIIDEGSVVMIQDVPFALKLF